MKSSTHSGLEVPDRDRHAARLDVQREVAPHRAQPDDAEARSRHDATTCATARARTRDRAIGCAAPRDSSAVRLSSPSETTRDVPVCPTARGRLHAGPALGQPQVQIEAAAGQRDAARSATAGRCPGCRSSRRRPTAARSSSSAPNSAAAGRSDASMHRRLNDDGGVAHLRQVEELRHQRPPARQPRPAHVAERRVDRTARSRTSSRLRRIGVEHDAVGQLDQVRRAPRVGPPRHQITVGRLDSRSAATALSMKLSCSPFEHDDVRRAPARRLRRRSLRNQDAADRARAAQLLQRLDHVAAADRAARRPRPSR